MIGPPCIHTDWLPAVLVQLLGIYGKLLMCAVEGDPYSDSVAAILHFQQLTMEAMYDAIYQALREADSDRTPLDYLQFMCLGKREEGPQEGPESVKGKASAGVLSHRYSLYCGQFLHGQKLHMQCTWMTISASTALAGHWS